MTVIMMNSLSRSLVINPYNISVVPTEKPLTTAVTPIHQTSKQSNNFSTKLLHSQVPSFRTANRENEFIPSMSIYELEHLVTNAVQDKINETSVDIQAKKQSLWQLGLQQQYIESQKAVLNAYVVSATGESTGDTTLSLMNNESLSGKYISLFEQETKLRGDDINKPDFFYKPNVPGDVEIQPVPETIAQLTIQQMINQYNNVQYQGRSSLLHLSA